MKNKTIAYDKDIMHLFIDPIHKRLRLIIDAKDVTINAFGGISEEAFDIQYGKQVDILFSKEATEIFMNALNE